jgi:pyruvate-ferredoxin/flavodoxin oxidoreductase
MLIANATGCSSIYDGNLPTTPYCKRSDGRGPSWSNSLFEDNAEYGLGMRQSVSKLAMQTAELLHLAVAEGMVNQELDDSLLNAVQKTQDEIEAQRGRVEELKKALACSKSVTAARLLPVADYLVNKNQCGYSAATTGLTTLATAASIHVLASGENVNVLVLDTEVYSNTGGQMSKSTPRAAVAQFAVGGKKMAKKDMGMIFSTYGNIYVARV